MYQPQTIDLFRLLVSESARFPALAQSLVINDKAPFTQQLTQFLEQQKKAGRLSIKDTERAAAFFMGQLKEYHFWPMMLGFVSTSALPKKDALIAEAVAIFEKFYLTSKSGDQS